jgi:exosortase F-associated protein
MGIENAAGKFIANRTVRFMLNDVACLLLITAIFNSKKYLALSFWVFLTELFILLPIYFLLKLSLEGDSEISSPLLSQLHRMIVNPLLMIVLIMGFFYQDHIQKQRAK